MKFALGTTNKAKEKAVREWSESEGIVDFELNCVKVESGVSDMPTSDNECIEGAINRARNALKEVVGANYGIGLEGGVEVKNEYMFLNGWAAVVDRNGVVGIGGSCSVEVPDEFRKQIENGKELGEVMQGLHQRDVRHEEGSMGIFSGGRIPRNKAFYQALSCAFAKFDEG